MKQVPAGVTPPAYDKSRSFLSVSKKKKISYTSVKHCVMRVIMRNIRASFFTVTFFSLLGDILKPTPITIPYDPPCRSLFYHIKTERGRPGCVASDQRKRFIYSLKKVHNVTRQTIIFSKTFSVLIPTTPMMFLWCSILQMETQTAFCLPCPM